VKARTALLLVAGVGLILALVLLSGADIAEVGVALLRGTVGTPAAVEGTLRETTPLLITGCAAYLALQAGLFNLGVEGQFVVGAFTTALVCLLLPGPMGVMAAVCASAAAGAFWALPAALIKAYRGGHEVITGIMLNAVAAFVTTALVAGAFRDPGAQTTTTASLGSGSLLPNLFANATFTVNSAIMVGLALVLMLAWWLLCTVAGFEVRAAGKNENAARLAGIFPKRVVVSTLVASGAIAGFAGAIQVVGYEGRFYSGFSAGYGFTALGVALLAGKNPLGILPAALFFGILSKSAAPLQIVGVPKGLTLVVVGVAIVVFAAFKQRGSRAGVAAV
jgi:ABC-type uncharacterized transport system permease subunit